VAEGGIEGLLGEESENAEAQAGLAAPDSVAVAVAMDAAKSNPNVAAGVLAYLGKQSQLVDLQLKHFDEERRLAIAAAKRKRLSDRLRIALQMFVALLALAGVSVVVALFWDAFTDNGIKINAFTVPTDLAEKGLTGEVVANQIVDRIAEMDRETTTLRASNSFTNNWGKDLRVEFPETGISIGEISHWIHETFGHATRVEGEVYHTADGFAVGIRLGHEAAIQVSGAETALSTLVREATTRIYALTQPYRYGYWLMFHGKIEEADAVFRQLAFNGNAVDRVWALHGLALIQSTDEKTFALEQRALATDRHFLPSSYTLVNVERDLGREEAALSAVLTLLADARGVFNDTVSPFGRTYIVASAKELRDTLLCDYGSANTMSASVINSLPPDNLVPLRASERLRQAVDFIRLHDPENAAGILEMLPAIKSSQAEITRSITRALLEAERGDWGGAFAEIEQTNASNHGETVKELAAYYRVFAADLYVHAGRNKEADTLVTSSSHDNCEGWRARGHIALLRKNYASGEQALAEAVRQAPSIPLAYNDCALRQRRLLRRDLQIQRREPARTTLGRSPQGVG
jgi:hypothetical protein